MTSLAESVRALCPELSPDLIEMHFRRMPGSYLEGCSASDIARHLRLIALLKSERPVEVEIRPADRPRGLSRLFRVDVGNQILDAAAQRRWRGSTGQRQGRG